MQNKSLVFFGMVCLFGKLAECGGSSTHPTRRLVAQSATYNPTYEAPACLGVGSSCDSGALVMGVKSFELNYPNTLYSTCADTSESVYQQDEYINSVAVRSKDGGVMRAGNPLELVVNVNTATSVTGRGREDAKQTLHVFYASEHYVRNDPAYIVSPDPASHFYGGHWKYITSTLLDPMQDSVTSVLNFEIPVDNYFNSTTCEPNCGLQALRINYGYGEYAISPCTSFPLWGTSFTDADDLVFRVEPYAQDSPPTQTPTASLETLTDPPTHEKSDFRFVCANSMTEALTQCLDNPECPTGRECSDGTNCYPIHCSDCPFECLPSPSATPTYDITSSPSLSPVSSEPTSSPQTFEPTRTTPIASTSFPTAMLPGSSVLTSKPTLEVDEDDAYVAGGGHDSTGEDLDDDYDYVTMGDDNADFDILVYDDDGDGVNEDDSVLKAEPSESPSNLPSDAPTTPLEELRLYDKVPPNEEDSAGASKLLALGCFLASILMTTWI